LALTGDRSRAALGVIIALAMSTSGRAQDAGALFNEALRRDMEGGAAEAAFQLYLRAAEAGYPEAQFNVAAMLDTGRGVTSDIGRAATWYGRAASHGVKRAAYNLGQLYETGQGVPRNPDIARAWFEASQLPAAKARMANMVPETQRTGILSAPSLVSPATNVTLSSGVELVWTSRPQPEPVQFYVEVRIGVASAPRDVFSSFVSTTSINVPLREPGAYAWRVLAVARKAGRYATSDWATFRLDAPSQ
jgi:hypothetical protein